MKNYMKLIFGLGLIALVGYWPAAKTPKRVNSLFLQNVEALARHEDSEKIIGMSKCSIYFFYGGGGSPKERHDKQKNY